MRRTIKRDRRVLIVAAVGCVLSAGVANVSYAQKAETDSAREVRHDKEAASLAKASQNPVANMVSLPLPYNYYANGGLGTASEMCSTSSRCFRCRSAGTGSSSRGRSCPS